jgi:arginine decarboxylase
MHNLFGDTNAVHVRLGEGGEVVLETVIDGDTVREALEYVEFDVNMLVKKLRTDVETAVRENRLDFQECGKLLRFYEEGLQGYTYLEEAR